MNKAAKKQYFHERYFRLKNEHKCVACKTPLEESRTDVRCEHCRAKQRAAEQKCYQKRKLQAALQAVAKGGEQK